MRTFLLSATTLLMLAGMSACSTYSTANKPAKSCVCDAGDCGCSKGKCGCETGTCGDKCNSGTCKSKQDEPAKNAEGACTKSKSACGSCAGKK